jgi:hypothetical protein
MWRDSDDDESDYYALALVEHGHHLGAVEAELEGEVGEQEVLEARVDDQGAAAQRQQRAAIARRLRARHVRLHVFRQLLDDDAEDLRRDQWRVEAL